MAAYPGILETYRSFLDIPEYTRTVTLLEGNTPLIPMPRLAETLGGGFELHVKFEGLNPTGSFKDRGMTVAISEAFGRQARTVICASTGNTAASAAAYAARAGMRSIVIIPAGKVAAGKLAGAIVYGAEVIQIDGSFDDAINLVLEITERHPIVMVNSLNPYRLEGQKTAAFEICEVMGTAPDWLALPVGNAGNITAYWMGFQQMHGRSATGLPHILGVQAEGSAPLVLGHAVENPETIATAIRIGNPASWKQAEAARDESGGLIGTVTDNQILSAYKLLAAKEGIFAEPASCASVAGLIKLFKNGYFKREKELTKIACILTGHGLKDPDRAIQSIKKPKVVKPSLKVILKEIGY